MHKFLNDISQRDSKTIIHQGLLEVIIIVIESLKSKCLIMQMVFIVSSDHH